MNPMDPFLSSCGHDESRFLEVSDDDHRNTFPCGACRTAIVGRRFSCSHCIFHLHPFCKTRPATLSSSLHPKHALSLVSVASSAVSRVCDVCLEPVRGIYYTCLHRRCDFDVHPQCSQLSPWVRHALDPRHCLELKHRRPRTTRCNVCGVDCGGWGYRCGACSIDVHYWCLWKPAAVAGSTTTTRSVLPDYHPRYGFSGAPQPSQQPFYFGHGGGSMPYWWPGNNHGYNNGGGGSGIGSNIGAMNITGSLAVSLLSNLAANLIQNGFSF